MENETKLWLTKTFWVQVATLCAAVLAMTGSTFGFDPEAFATTMLTLAAVVNTGVRVVTSRRVTL